MGKMKTGFQRRLTREDRKILRHYELMADGIARCFGNACEVVVHSLEDTNHSVIKIVNGHVTGRDLGAPITDLGLEILYGAHRGEGDIVGPYTSTTATGNLLHSVTSIIRNDGNHIIGFVCINFNLSANLQEILATFSSDRHGTPAAEVREHFSANTEELVIDSYRGVAEPLQQWEGISPLERNRQIVTELHKRGVFNIKGAVEIIARSMGVSKFTIYGYLRKCRNPAGTDEVA